MKPSLHDVAVQRPIPTFAVDLSTTVSDLHQFSPYKEEGAKRGMWWTPAAGNCIPYPEVKRKSQRSKEMLELEAST